MTTTAAVGYLTVHREVNDFQRDPGPSPGQATGYQRQAGRGLPGGTDYYAPDAGPFEPGQGPATDWYQDDRSAGAGPAADWYQDDRSAGAGPAADWYQDDRSPDEDPLWMAGQVLTLADDKAAQLAQEAQIDAAAIRDAAERDATATREAAKREAAELRARLDSMLDELGRVVAAYVTQVAPPEMPAAAPAHRSAAPVPQATTSAPPATKPARPDTAPGTKPSAPAKPRTAPAQPRTGSTKKSQTQGRQLRAMRIAKYSTAALVSFALLFGGAEIGLHGYKFFVFREGGQGQTKTNATDTGFLAQQAAAAHHPAPKGRHHKTSQQSATSKAHG